ncbi:MAG: hypothetical protein J6T60_10720 [Bacteroidales bacterium]|nr:hypothetical protein [Bacteroidales bacterium]
MFFAFNLSNIPIKKTLSALDQIDDRDYIAATLDDDRRIVKLAIKFSSKDRHVGLRILNHRREDRRGQPRKDQFLLRRMVL